MTREIKKGQIYYADLSPVVGSEQGGYRPVLIIQNDKGNKHAPTTIVAIITSRKNKANLPTHIWLPNTFYVGLKYESMVELEQIRTIDKSRLKDYIGVIDHQTQSAVDVALKISLGI